MTAPIAPESTPSPWILRAQQLIERIDKSLCRQLDAILHHPRFQELEAAWRGLELLAAETPRARRTKIALLDVSWTEVRKDLDRTLDFDQSSIFWLIYTTEFDMPGGEPYGVMVCNYRISHRNEADLRALRKLSAAAEAAFCVMLFPASSELFGMNSFRDYHPSLRPTELFRGSEYRSWQMLRRYPSCRFLAFVLPPMLLRRPWSEENQRRGRFPYTESCEQHDQFLWGNPGFVLAGVLLREFEETGWFSHVRGAPRDTLAGGIVAGVLPERRVDACDDQFSVLPPVELIITDTAERELADCGFIAMAHCWQTAYEIFLSLPSLYQLKLSGSEENAENERIGSQIHNVLCASRFAHHVKVLMRDKIGSFLSAEACEDFLLEWLQQYCVGGDNLDWETRARFPLRNASVSVRENFISPGHYFCDISLSPHYQYDGFVGEINLTTEFAQAAAGTES